MTLAAGIFKQLIFKKQSGLGSTASGAGAQLLRRTSSSLNLKKATYTSKEIRPSQQRSDIRHGIRSVEGTISGELSVGTYQSFVESVLRKTAVSITTQTASTITIATAGGYQGTLTTSGSTGFISAGWIAGTVFTMSGCTGAGNNSANCLILSVTSTVITFTRLDATAVTAEATGNSISLVCKGKQTYVPSSSHTRDYYTIEHNYSDITQAEQFIDCVIDSMSVKLPATGMGTIDFGVKGLNMTSSTSSSFTSPTSATTTNIVAAVNGALFVSGTQVAIITGIDINVKGNSTMPGGIVGSNVDPDIFPGAVDVDGQITVLFQDATMRNYFVNETEVSIIVALTTNNTSTADVVVFTIPRAKVNAADKDDGEKGLIMTMPFVGIEKVTSTSGVFPSTIGIHDTQFT